MNWRPLAEWAKRRPSALRVVERLGKGRGGLRFLDHVGKPKAAPLRPDLSRWEDAELAAAWIGHATVLIRLGGMTVLADPVFANRVGVGLGLMTGGPRRLVLPALKLDELPKIDLVLLSHAHFDHLCRPTLNKLDKRTRVVTAENTQDLVRDLGYGDVHELRWGESLDVGPLKLTARKVRHWGARTFNDSHRGFNAYLLEAGRRRVLFGGDTARCDYFSDLPKVDLAILGIGGYFPAIHCHANPEQAWEMAGHMRADYLLPMHHRTFRLGMEPVDEPIERMMTVAGRHADRVVVREVGGTFAI